MDAHTLLEEWEVSPFDGGFEGLRDLQARGFSGAVESGESTLFLRDGDALAVVEDLADDPRPGDVDAFEGGGGDRYTAGRPETATLAAMLALDGEVRGQYFTEDTSLSTVHETLSDGGFTGYVELSENVLSGDYYVVYRDGREEYVAFVGSSNQVLVADEARTRARGEVGIYSVVAVSLPEVELPAAATSGGAAGGAVTPDDARTSDATADPTGGDAEPTGEPAVADADDGGRTPNGGPSADERADAGTPDATPAAGSPDGPAGTGAADGADAAGEAAPGDVPAASTSSTDPAPTAQAPRDGDGNGSATAGSERPGTSTEPTEAARDGSAEDDSSAAGGRGDGGGGTADEPERTADSDGTVIDAVSSRTVPSLDPQNSRRVQVDAADAAPTQAVETAPSDPGSDLETTASEAAPSSPPVARDDTPSPETAGGDAGDQRDGGSVPAGGEGTAGASPAEPEPDAHAEERVAAVREEYEGRLEELRNEVDQLRAERDDLRRRIESLQSDGAGASDAGAAGTRSLSPAEALDGTSLFVREGTRGGATLEDALAGEADRETLTENVRIEYHTEFDDDGATVEGQPFEAWLHETAHYRFVRWAIVDLPFEIRATGSASAMRPLVEALPEVDRVGLRDGVAAADGDGERTIEFDVVARDQMGDPLFVASIDESREPTAGDAIEPLVTDAADVCEHHDSLAGTFAVTSSYFEPAALDTVREATSGSLLGRQKYRSYVKLSRSNGFHLCTVEQRKGEFHLTVPEL